VVYYSNIKRVEIVGKCIVQFRWDLEAVVAALLYNTTYYIVANLSSNSN